MDYTKYVNPDSLKRIPSVIRELSKTKDSLSPDTITLSAGVPDPNTFPFEEINVTTRDGHTINLKGDNLNRALQYLATPGLPELKCLLKDIQVKVHNPPMWEEREVLVIAGAQHGLSMTIEAFLTTGDAFVVPEAIYPGVTNSASRFDPEYLPVGEDSDGMRPDLLKKVLEERKESGKAMAKLMYVSPTGGNPTGTCIPLDRKKEIYQIASHYDLIILEDDPYYYLHFQEDLTPSFLSLDVDGRVIRVDSFSKVISSGLRIGFTTAPKAISQIFELHMQSTVFHAASLSQVLTLELLQQWGFSGLMQHTRKLQQEYKKKRDGMLAAAERHLQGLAEWNVPNGGMFLWINVKGIKSTKEMMMERGPKKKVILAPGFAFQTDRTKPSCHLRASFSSASDKDMDVAFSRLAELIREEQHNNGSNGSV